MSTTACDDLLRRLEKLERRLEKLEAKEAARTRRRPTDLKPGRRFAAEPFVGVAKSVLLEMYGQRGTGIEFTATELAQWANERGHGDSENGRPAKRFVTTMSAALQLLGLRATKSNDRRLFRLTPAMAAKWAGQ